MTRGRPFVLALSLALTFAGGAAGVRTATVVRAQSQPKAPTGTAAIRGMVLAADTSRPLRLAHVVLIGSATGTLRVTSSDADGRFAFAALPADRYTIGASKPPYLGAVAGARRPARSGTPVVLGIGQTADDVTIRLPLGAAITGVITDERGQPAMNVSVALRQWRQQGAERVLVDGPGGTVRTDDQGRYRLFGLTPGEYLVAAMRFSGTNMPGRALTESDVDAAMKEGTAPAVPADASLRYAPVFFPGTARASDAATIAVASGDERQGVDFRMQVVTSARVEGVVLSADGQPVVTATTWLVTAQHDNLLRNAFVARPRADGRVLFPNVMPDSYTALATASGPLAGHFATAQIEVSGADLSGIVLTLRPPLVLSGRLVFEGAAPTPALAGHRLPLRALSGTAADGPTAVQVAATDVNGAFTISRLLPGRYVLGGPLLLGASADSVRWSVGSVVVDGRDVTDLPLVVAADAAPKSVIITYIDRWQEISGRVQTRDAAASEHTVIVFPAETAYWIHGSRRILTTRPATDGRFVLGGPGPATLPAGDYLVAIVADIARDEQYDPAFLASLVASATRVTLQAGERKVIDLNDPGQD